MTHTMLATLTLGLLLAASPAAAPADPAPPHGDAHEGPAHEAPFGDFDALDELEAFALDLELEPALHDEQGGRGDHGRHGMRGPRGRHGMHGMHGMHGRRAAHAFHALDLTPAQRERMEAIHDRQRRRAIQLRADLALARLDLHRLMRAERPDRAQIDTQIDRLARMRGEMQKARVATLLEAREVLTPEQRERMKSLRGHGGRGGHMRHGHDGPHGEGHGSGPEGEES